jgi:hypothetical protein
MSDLWPWRVCEYRTDAALVHLSSCIPSLNYRLAACYSQWHGRVEVQPLRRFANVGLHGVQYYPRPSGRRYFHFCGCVIYDVPLSKRHCRSYCEPLTLSLAVVVPCLVVLQLLRLALGTEFPEDLALPDGLCRRIPQGKVRLVPVTVFSAWVRCTVPD